jgi:hypothetical protein
MDTNIPYVLSVTNLPKILEAIQKAAVPDSFNLDFLKDLGFASSSDRPVIKVLKYLGMLDGSNRPLQPYRDFVDHNKSKTVLAERMRAAFDDLFNSNPDAYNKSSDSLKGWFKSKTGVSDSVAMKLASQFKALADYADFKSAPSSKLESQPREDSEPSAPSSSALPPPPSSTSNDLGRLGLVYRFEIHLPDTTNVETFRAIFRAMREELSL